MSVSGSLDDDMVELRVEIGDLRDDRLNLLFSLCSAPDRHGEGS